MGAINIDVLERAPRVAPRLKQGAHGTIDNRVVLLAGPRLSGKSRVTDELVRTGEYCIAKSAVTRKKRPNEQGRRETHLHVDNDEFRRMQDGGNVVFSYVVQRTGVWYGLLKEELERSDIVPVQGVVSPDTTLAIMGGGVLPNAFKVLITTGANDWDLTIRAANRHYEPSGRRRRKKRSPVVPRTIDQAVALSLEQHDEFDRRADSFHIVLDNSAPYKRSARDSTAGDRLAREADKYAAWNARRVDIATRCFYDVADQLGELPDSRTYHEGYVRAVLGSLFNCELGVDEDVTTGNLQGLKGKLTFSEEGIDRFRTSIEEHELSRWYDVLEGSHINDVLSNERIEATYVKDGKVYVRLSSSSKPDLSRLRSRGIRDADIQGGSHQLVLDYLRSELNYVTCPEGITSPRGLRDTATLKRDDRGRLTGMRASLTDYNPRKGKAEYAHAIRVVFSK